MVLCLHELFGLDHVVRRQDVECSQLSLHCFPVRMIIRVKPSIFDRVARHQMLVTILIADIVCFSDAICTTQLKLKDLLCRCLIKRVRKSIVALCKFFGFDQMFVVKAPSLLCVLTT